jgi:hypothetical protein
MRRAGGWVPAASRLAAVALVAATVVAGCTGPAVSSSGPQAILDAQTAFAIAETVAEIGGPFQPIEVVAGRFADLDPESHNAPSDPTAPARWQELADRAVWRVTFAGPNGVEAVVLDAANGEVLASIVQGQ